tara:strand:- start:378 stop:596 length:219 start_codon:yes stop_codon:yes gene_type:complete
MDFLEDLIKINNEIKLNELAIEMKLDDQEKVLFIKKYNKSNNRLFTKKGGKKYMIDEYRVSIFNYNNNDVAL